jgi:hypothetical protein
MPFSSDNIGCAAPACLLGNGCISSNQLKDFRSGMNTVLRWFAIVLVAAAVACICVLLTNDTKIHVPLGLSAPAISAVALLLIGVSFLILQAILRPRWTELLKNVMLAAAFILWGVVQLMEQNDLSRKLADVVIALYVLDLAWMISAGVNPVGAVRSNVLKSNSSRK